MRDNINLVITRSKVHIDILYKGELIGRIKVADGNRGAQCALHLTSDKDITYFKIVKQKNEMVKNLIDDSYFNKEEFNK